MVKHTHKVKDVSFFLVIHETCRQEYTLKHHVTVDVVQNRHKVEDVNATVAVDVALDDDNVYRLAEGNVDAGADVIGFITIHIGDGDLVTHVTEMRRQLVGRNVQLRSGDIFERDNGLSVLIFQRREKRSRRDR